MKFKIYILKFYLPTYKSTTNTYMLLQVKPGCFFLVCYYLAYFIKNVLIIYLFYTRSLSILLFHLYIYVKKYIFKAEEETEGFKSKTKRKFFYFTS